MYRRIAFVVAAVVAMSACSGDGSVFNASTDASTTSSEGTTTSSTAPGTTTEGTATTTATTAGTSTSTTTGSGGEQYPQGIVDAYMDGCTESGDRSFCLCTIDEFQKRLTLDEFLALEAGGDLSAQEVVLEVTQACLGSVTAGSTTTTTAPPDLQPLTMDEVITLTIDDLVVYWSSVMPDLYGTGYEDVSETIPYYPSSGDVPPCGPDPIPPEAYYDNAFYCRPGDFVAWDAEGLFPSLWEEFGDFTIAFVLAHEWGHAIQARGQVFGPTIMTELQADCFAGSWAAEVDLGNSENLILDPGDLEEAMAGFLLFRDPPGTSPNDPQAHGSAFDRFNAFQDGFFNGATTCARYEDGNYVVVDIPLTPQDIQTGGNLPFAETAPLLGESLETYWAIAFPELFGTDYAALSDYGPYLPSTGLLPRCGEGEPNPADYIDNAFYCPDGDFVAWDEENLFPALYDNIGDFAIGVVMAHEWATAVQARAGLPMEGLEAELQADCFTGAWAAALIPEDNPTGILLSPGDLDEAISGFLAFGDDPISGESFAGTPFERFDAFQRGFFDGPAACLEG
jgi:predicted metalloprotease